MPRPVRLSHSETVLLIRRYQCRETDAMESAERLLAANVGLVTRIVHRYLPGASSLQFDDLYIEGQLAMLRAAERFNPACGTRFSTYATHWIKHNILRAIEREDPALRGTLSLDAPTGEGDETFQDTLIDTREDIPNVLLAAWAADAMQQAGLTPRERRVIELRFGFGGDVHTLAQTGVAIGGLTREGVRRIERKALDKLRTAAGKIDREAP